MKGMTRIIPAGGAVRARRDRRLMNAATSEAGRSLGLSWDMEHLDPTHGDAKNVSSRRKKRARYLTWRTDASSNAYKRR